jgi:hypothetical protein
VRYHFLPPLLLAEVQRLERERAAHATRLSAQDARLVAQEDQLQRQAQELAALRSLVDTLTAAATAKPR